MHRTSDKVGKVGRVGQGRRAGAVGVLVGLSACASLSGGVRQSEFTRLQPAHFQGPECARALYSLQEVGDNYSPMSRQPDPSPEGQILLAVCERAEKKGVAGRMLQQWPRIEEVQLKDAYLAIDDRRLDPLSLAIGVVHKAAQIDPHKAPPQSTDVSRQDLALGQLVTQLITGPDVERALAGVKLPAAAKQAFQLLYAAAPSRVGQITLSPVENMLLVGIPLAVLRKRAKHFAAFANLYSKLDELMARAQAAGTHSADLDAVTTALTELRSAFIKTCGTAECRDLPLYGYATRELAQLQVLRNDELAARAESYLQLREGAWVAGFPQAVYLAQQEEGEKVREAYQKYQHAKESGSDEATALRLAGGTSGLDWRPEMTIQPKMSLPDYSAAIAKSTAAPESAPVLTLQRVGARTKVTFKKDTHKPISLPNSQAQWLRAGDVVSFFASGENAEVLQVTQGDHIVQVRGDRL